MRAGCLPRLIGINCARLQSRTESLTLAASQHFSLIVLMIMTRADDHCGALIVRRVALRLLPARGGDESHAVPIPVPISTVLEWAGGATDGQEGSPGRGHCPPTLCQGGGKDRGGDSSPLPSREPSRPLALPHGRRVAGGRQQPGGKISPTLRPLWGWGVPKGAPHWPCPEGGTGSPCTHGCPKYSHILTGCCPREHSCT